MAPKTTTFDRNNPLSWEGLGQTFPEFTTGGSASYGVRRTPYFVTSRPRAQRIGTTAYLNPASSDYAQVIAALQGAPVNGISRVGTFDRVSGLDGLFDDFTNNVAAGWGVIGRKAAEAKDAIVAKTKAAADYATDPAKFANDIAKNLPGASALIGQVVDAMVDAQKKSTALYNTIQKYKDRPKKPPEWDNYVREQQKAWAQLTAFSYALHAVPEISARLKSAGVPVPDVKNAAVLSAITSSTIAKKVYEQVKARNQTGALGVVPVAVVAVAVIAQLGVILGALYLLSKLLGVAQDAINGYFDKQADETLAKAGASAGEIAAARKDRAKARVEEEKERNKGGLGGFMSYLPWIVGGVVVVAFLPTLTAAGQAGATALRARQAAAPVQGLGRTRRRR